MEEVKYRNAATTGSFVLELSMVKRKQPDLVSIRFESSLSCVGKRVPCRAQRTHVSCLERRMGNLIKGPPCTDETKRVLRKVASTAKTNAVLRCVLYHGKAIPAKNAWCCRASRPTCRMPPLLNSLKSFTTSFSSSPRPPNW